MCQTFGLVSIVLGVCLAVATSGDLQVLDGFDVTYTGAVPVTSMSQKFTDLGDLTWVETAVPIAVQPNEVWDIRAMRFDVLVGRRSAGSSGVFVFDWDGASVLQRFGARLHIYLSCPSESHTTGKPCPTPAAIYNAKLQASSTTIIHTNTMGVVYRVDVFLSRDPATPGYTTGERVWASFFATMPSRYVDTVDGLTYELRAWVAVDASASEETDLAIADHSDLLGRGWTDWRHGQVLSNSLYQGIDYPSPGFSVVGYVQDPLPTASPSKIDGVVVNDTNHWPSGLPPPVKSSGVNGSPPGTLTPITIGFLAGGGGLFLCVCMAGGGLFAYGLRRRHLRRQRNKIDAYDDDLYDPNNTESKRLVIRQEDGTFSAYGDAYPRTTTSQATGSPLSPSLNVPYPSPKTLDRADESSDEFQ